MSATTVSAIVFQLRSDTGVSKACGDTELKSTRLGKSRATQNDARRMNHERRGRMSSEEGGEGVELIGLTEGCEGGHNEVSYKVASIVSSRSQQAWRRERPTDLGKTWARRADHRRS